MRFEGIVEDIDKDFAKGDFQIGIDDLNIDKTHLQLYISGKPEYLKKFAKRFTKVEINMDVKETNK